jgi:hypothetical protein
MLRNESRDVDVLIGFFEASQWYKTFGTILLPDKSPSIIKCVFDSYRLSRLDVNFIGKGGRERSLDHRGRRGGYGSHRERWDELIKLWREVGERRC